MFSFCWFPHKIIILIGVLQIIRIFYKFNKQPKLTHGLLVTPAISGKHRVRLETQNLHIYGLIIEKVRNVFTLLHLFDHELIYGVPSHLPGYQALQTRLKNWALMECQNFQTNPTSALYRIWEISARFEENMANCLQFILSPTLILWRPLSLYQKAEINPGQCKIAMSKSHPFTVLQFSTLAWPHF